MFGAPLEKTLNELSSINSLTGISNCREIDQRVSPDWTLNDALELSAKIGREKILISKNKRGIINCFTERY